MTWSDKINQIWCGDYMELMKTMPDKCVDLVLTDPPYGISYQGENRPNEKDYEIIKNDNLEIDYKKLIANLERISKDVVIIFGAENFYQGLPHKGRWIVWDKRPEQLTNEILGSPVELAWTNRESGYYRIYRVIHGGFVNADRDELGRARIHPTQKPKRLFSQIIQDYSEEGDLIFDPFMGSWTTARACKDLGRNFIGAELSPDYCEIGKQRLRQQILI